MENHPIPQDVTGFKFRLIGSVTVKQFLYLLGGGVIALLFYLLPLPFIAKIPFMFFSGGIALSLAFVPIDGRPMDKMIYNFLRAIPSENQYIYRKQGVEMPYFSFAPPVHTKPITTSSQDSATLKKTKLFNQLAQSYFKPDPEESQKVESISALFQGETPQTSGFTTRIVNADTAPATPTPSPISVVKPVINEAVPLATQPVPITQTPNIAHSASAPQPALSTPPAPTPPPSSSTPSHAGGIDMANILQGTIHDPRGKPVPHVIVEVLNGQNIPLRTFRTDGNGFFRAATPLPNGTYTIHMEDTLKKQEFENVPVVMNGSILQPIQITSTDQREKLRRELFGVAHNSPSA